jgi:16S rRNA (cytosine967-C5)-methyltransferase
MSARGVALDVLGEVERGGQRASAALDGALAADPSLSPEDRGLATELVYGVLRHQGRLDRALAGCIHDGARGLRRAHPVVRRALRVAAYQLLLLQRVPAAAAVDAAVTSVRREREPRSAGFVNAVLRRLEREGEPPMPDARRHPGRALVEAFSLPPWLAKRLLRWLGPDDAVRLARAMLERPPQTARVPGGPPERCALQAELAAGKPPVPSRPTAHAPQGLHLEGLRDPARHPLHVAGRFILQDEASQLVGHLMSPRPGERLLDACAGRGGKTLHLTELQQARPWILPLDRNQHALRTLTRRALTLGMVTLPPLQADAQAPLPLRGTETFHRVLLDAPCSGLGVLRRHPEAKWRLSPADLVELANRQEALLYALADRVRPGGLLVYAVCTMNPEEGPARVVSFCRTKPEFRPEPPPAGALDWSPLLADPAPDGLPAGAAITTRPDRHGLDGFFMVRLRRSG